MIKLIKNSFYNEKLVKEGLCNFIRDSKKLSMDGQCKNFEKKFSQWQGRKISVLFNSGSSANLALIQALLNLNILKKGDKVGFSALTWATNVMPLIQLGLVPIPLDISLKNLNVNSENLLETVDKNNLKALFITNLLGFCGDLDNIEKICKNKGIILLEDNCESLGSEYKNKKLGNFGVASTFSFFVGHHLSTIEGGMVCTDDEDLGNMLKMVRAHGWGRDLSSDLRKELKNKYGINDFYEQYSFYCLGYNLRPTEITGFLGLSQLKYLEEIIEKRKKNFGKFNKEAIKNKSLFHLDLTHMNVISNFAYPLIFKDKADYQNAIKNFSKDIETRPIVGGNIPSQPFFLGSTICKNAEICHSRGFYIPNNPDLNEKEIEKMCLFVGGKIQ